MFKIKIWEFTNTSSSRKSGAGTYYSEQPYEVGAFESGTIIGYFYNFGNDDNNVVLTVQWGESLEGEFPFEHNTPASSTLFFIDDTLTATVDATSTLTDKIWFKIDVPVVKANFMKVKMVLTGTSAQFDSFGYFRPRL